MSYYTDSTAVIENKKPEWLMAELLTNNTEHYRPITHGQSKQADRPIASNIATGLMRQFAGILLKQMVKESIATR